MKDLAVLGPKGTYCDIASKKLDDKYNVLYYPSILKTSLAVNENIDGLLPFENTLDGFVMETLDNLTKSDYHIVKQVKLHIGFSFVSNSNIEDVKEVFVQFKAYGQCIHFFSENDFKVNITESNIISLEEVINKGVGFGAIIPNHLLDEYKFKTVIKDVTDSLQIETRFIYVSESEECELDDKLSASLALTPLEDKPGVLFSILAMFNGYNFNLKAILSRPRKDEIGKYIFYIELYLLKKEINKLNKLKNNLNDDLEINVKLLGIYNSI